jgi:WD40 repeat protein/type II secretory pathway predicted ATPase ExeA
VKGEVSPAAFTVRFLTKAATAAGIGALVTERHIITCAHVVNVALGRDHTSQDKPTELVTVDFPLLAEVPTVQARITLWVPPPRAGAAGADIAGLEITELPAQARPIRLAVDPPRPGTTVRVFGCPADRPDGTVVEAAVQGVIANGRLQLDSLSARRIEQGFSGSPVLDETTGQLAGLIALAPARAGERDSYAIGAERLRLAWPQVFGEAPKDNRDLTILHVPSLRFGHTDSGHTDKEPPDLETKPDLIVVTGDLTEHALPSEYQRAVEFLTVLAATAGVPRRHVAIVPGSRDVSRVACQAYFADQQSREKNPVPPYFPKWSQFAEAFGEFYGDDDRQFTPDEPWTLFTMPALGVTVAGLNSTMALSHRDEDEHGWVGHHQLSWFSERLTQEPRTIIAVHHDPESADFRDGEAIGRYLTGTLLHATDRYELSTIPAHTPSDVIPVKPAKPRDDFFERVVEATRVRHPGATVTERPDDRYLRVTSPKPDGITEQWPVGVLTGPATEQAVTDFAQGVHAQFAARDPQVRSELVHDGPGTPAPLTRLARRHGIRLRSLIEYQGMLDLRPLAEAQRERLATDRIYAERLYVPQRFRLVNDEAASHELVEHAIDWLAADSAQLIVVLGDFGRGKTAFLRQLSRTISAELTGLLPILVELRRLEKAPTLEALLISHLASQGVRDIDAAKLQYMVRSGRLALLFDGFDELELRVGYDNADDYLRTLLASVTEQAKVVLTSRTQHFRSNQQVLTALGERVAALAGSRVVLLEDLSDDQIAEFLAKLYDGDQARALIRLELISGIANLRELAHNPRMLAFIAALEDEKLRAVSDSTAAGLYREIIDSWLARETERQTHHRGMPALTQQERFDACTVLALRLWAAKSATIGLGDLSDSVTATLTGLAERGFSDEQLSHAIGSGSLLVRTDDGAFAFVHRSVMEWLVAHAAATDPAAAAVVLTGQRMSALMARFYADLAGPEATRDWAAETLAGNDSAAVAKQNALMISGPTAQGRVPAPRTRRRPSLAGMDLRDQDLSGRFLRGADMRETDLRGMRLRGIDLRSANLSGADLRGARLDGCFLSGALLTGSRWDGAVVVGSDLRVRPPELAAAAMPEHDPADVMIKPSLSPVCVAYSPDGTLLAVGSWHHIEILPADDRGILRVIRIRDLRTFAFAPDGFRLACATKDSVVVLDVTTGDVVRNLRWPGAGTVSDIAFSPDGARVAVATSDGTRIWNATTGTLYDSAHSGRAALSVAFLPSPDGERVAVGWEDGAVTIGNTDIGRYPNPVRDIASSPDGTLVAVAVADKVRLWDLAADTERAVFDVADGGPVVQVTFSADGTQLTAAWRTGGVHSWDLDTGWRASRSLRGPVIRGFAFSPDGAQVAVARDSGVEVIRLNQMQGYGEDELRRSLHHRASLAFSTDGTALTATFFGLPRVWDLSFGTASPGERPDFIPDVMAYAPDGTRFAWTEGSAAIISHSPTSVSTLQGHRGMINDLAFSPDGALLVTASDDGTAMLWDAKKPGRVSLSTVSTYKYLLTAVAFAGGGTTIVTGSADGDLTLWDPGLFARMSARFDRALSHRSAEAKVIRFQPGCHVGRVHGLAAAADGSLLATAGEDGTTTIWTGDLTVRVATLDSHLGPVRAVAFSPDGTRLATAGEDRTVRIWTLAPGTGSPKPLMTLVDLPGSGYAALLPDGRYKQEGDPGGHLWWAVKLCRFAPGELDAHVPGLTRLPPDAPL